MNGMRANRWSDSDRYWWRFTYANDCSGGSYAIVLSADTYEGSDAGINSLRFTFGKRTLIIALPQIIKPWRVRKYFTAPHIGTATHYDVVHERAYGVSLHDAGTVGGATHLSVMHGRQTHDSSTEQRWGCFLPWTDWRFVRFSLYDLNGKHFWSESEAETKALRKLGSKVMGERFEIMRKWEEMCPKRQFKITDFDGQEITVTTQIEEREWRKGTGWFEWLSWFKRPMIRRSLSLSFSSELGPEKGSWKGGMIGHSIEMLPGELHEAAMRRYCEQEHTARGARRFRITYVGPVDAAGS